MTKATNEVIRQLELIASRGYNPRSVFDDWISLMIYSLMGNDEEYLKIVNCYANDRHVGSREIDYFTNAFGAVMVGMKEENRELLGEIYMRWGVHNKYKGQFFTPWEVAKLMAQITGVGKSVYDPCCGSGVMLVASAQEMTKEECDEAIFTGQDVDFTCVMMCALNMTFFNLNSRVIWGDTLQMEFRRVFQTARTPIGGKIRELTPEEVEKIRPQIQVAAAEIEKQQALF